MYLIFTYIPSPFDHLITPDIKVFRESLISEKKPKAKGREDKKTAKTKTNPEDSKREQLSNQKTQFSLRLIQNMLRIKKTQLSEEKLTNMSSAYETAKSRVTTGTIREESVDQQQSNSAERLRLRDYAKRVDEIEEEKFYEHFMEIILGRLGHDEDLTEVLMDSFENMTEFYVDAACVDRNDALMSQLSPSTGTSSRKKEAMASHANRRGNKGVKQQNSDRKNTTEGPVSFDRASYDANRGIVLVLKSETCTKLFFETLDESVLKSSPFETRKNTRAIRIFKNLRTYLPSYFNKTQLNQQTFRDSTFFDFVIQNPNDPRSEALEQYFEFKGFFNSQFGISSLYTYDGLLDSKVKKELEKVKSPPTKVKGKRGAKPEIRKKSSFEEEEEEVEREYRLKHGFVELVEFIKWTRSNQIAFLSQLENKAILSKMSSIPFSNLEIHPSRPKKKKQNMFDITDYKGSSFFFLFKVIIIIIMMILLVCRIIMWWTWYNISRSKFSSYLYQTEFLSVFAFSDPVLQILIRISHSPQYLNSYHISCKF